MIPAPSPPDGPEWEAVRDQDPVVQRYRRRFAELDWSAVQDWEARPRPGPRGHPVSACIKALLIKLWEGKPYVTDLRRFLVDHPLLVLEMAFRPVRDPTQPFGFDVARTVPGERHLRRRQQTLDPALLTALLAGTVRALQATAPELGETIAVDVKHLYAWVDENNPTDEVPQRFDPQRRPAGDPDCRLGAKRRHNGKEGKVKEWLWGYGWGIAAAVHPRCGDVILADWTQPFHHQDVTVFAPVYEQACAHLGHPPTNVAADAAFDSWRVHQVCAETGGIAAIPRNERGPVPKRTADGIPICAQGLAMTPGREFLHEDGFRARDHHCPLLRPCRTGETCAAAQFANGGCHKYINLEFGGRMRAELDRTSPAYQEIYRQRTCAERINSQAAALGVERPKVRRMAGVRRLTTLTAIVINVNALRRLDARVRTPVPLSC